MSMTLASLIWARSRITFEDPSVALL